MPRTAHKAPICQTCRSGMTLERITPCAAEYDMLSYRCAECACVFVMVEPRLEERGAVDEKRAVQRHAVATPATIVSGRRTIACTMHDVSATGASVRLVRSLRLPRQFTLTAAGSKLSCRAVWRRGREVGIAFQ